LVGRYVAAPVFDPYRVGLDWRNEVTVTRGPTEGKSILPSG
jgi:hypothetical protein